MSTARVFLVVISAGLFIAGQKRCLLLFCFLSTIENIDLMDTNNKACSDTKVFFVLFVCFYFYY